MQKPQPFTARRPLDLVAVVPHLLGFHPQDSVVLLTFGRQPAFHARVDLPQGEDDQRAVSEMLTAVVVRHRVRRVAVLVYTGDPWAAATVHDAVVPALVGRGVEIVDVLRVAADRFHAADEPDDPGTPYDLSTHPFTAEQVLEGKVVHRSRSELAATLQPVDPGAVAEVAEAAEAADRAASTGLCHDDLAGGARWVQQTVRGQIRSGSPLGAADAARLLALVACDDVRDVAWAEMSRAEADRHTALWSDLVRRSPRQLLPAAACLLAFAAWLQGHGALAWCALDRCLEADPGYSMADSVAGLLENAVPPTAWSGIAESDLRALRSEGPVAS
jgi:hypothetical protein